MNAKLETFKYIKKYVDQSSKHRDKTITAGLIKEVYAL